MGITTAQLAFMLGVTTQVAANTMNIMAANGADVIVPPTGRNKSIDAADVYAAFDRWRITPQQKVRSLLA